MKNIEEIRQLAFKHLGNRKTHPGREKGFIYYHGQRVAKLAINLRKLILPDDDSKDDIITVASYFHDVAKGIEPHFKYGAIVIKDILKGYCEEDEIEQIAEIIGNHTLRSKQNNFSDYVKIVQDADILDHYGTVRIWLNFSYHAHKDLPMEKAVEFYQNEYEKEIKEVRELLNYDISKKIFDDKVKFDREFIERFTLESRGDVAFNDSKIK